MTRHRILPQVKLQILQMWLLTHDLEHKPLLGVIIMLDDDLCPSHAEEVLDVFQDRIISELVVNTILATTAQEVVTLEQHLLMDVHTLFQEVYAILLPNRQSENDTFLASALAYKPN